MPTPPASLADLAAAHGIITTVRDARGRSTPVDPTVLRALLVAMKALDDDERDMSDDRHASDEDPRLTEALHRLEDERWTRVLPPHVVMREGWTPWVPVRVHEDGEFEAVIVLEDGEERRPAPVQNRVEPRVVDGVRHVQHTLEIPAGLPLGYHELAVTTGEVRHTCPLIVTPARLRLPKGAGEARMWGIATHLYALRSDRSWGIGESADLAELGTWAARVGADYVNVGPISADDPVPTIDPNPYRPVSRRMLDPLAVRVEEIRELGYLSAAEHQLVEWHGDDARRLNLTDEVDRDAVWASKRAALRMIFNVERSHRRRRDFETFLDAGGEELVDFATWCVLAREFGLPATSWPAPMQDARGEAVAKFRDAHAADVEFECWLQWIVRAQFADAQREVRAAGMRLGVMHDLAPGVIDGSFEQWVRPQDFADGVRVGAREASGEVVDLGLAALTPDALARDGFALWRTILADVLPLSGALRIERVGMLFRQWWMPTTSDDVTAAGGRSGAGASVRFDHEALIGILLLEAQRAGVAVIAGDEDETETWIRDYLAERGLIGSNVLWNDDGDKALAAHERSAHRVMAVPGRKDDSSLAARLGDAHEQEARRDRLVADVEAHAATLRARRAELLETLGRTSAPGSIEEQIGALYRRLAAGPALLLSVRVSDLVGDVRTPGLHGVEHVHALWRRPLAGPDARPLSLDDLMTSRRAKRLIRAVRRH